MTNCEREDLTQRTQGQTERTRSAAVHLRPLSSPLRPLRETCRRGLGTLGVVLFTAGCGMAEGAVVGRGAPAFEAATVEGERVSLAELRGEVVLLNVWATWCGPCRDEMPSMERLHRELAPQGLRIVAVSVDGAPGALSAGGNVAEFARELGLTFTIWHDPSGSVQRVYRTTGVPESFVIDRDGVIQKKVIGGTEWDEGSHPELLRRLLAAR